MHMKRITFWSVCALLFGVLLVDRANIFWGIGLAAAAFPAVGITVLVRFERRKFYRFIPLLCFLVGMTYMHLYAVHMEKIIVPFDGIEENVSGQIQEVIPRTNYTAVRLRTETIGDKTVHLRMELRLYDDAPVLLVGQRIETLARIARPSGLLNDGLFYYPDYLKARRIFLSGSANGDAVSFLDTTPHGWRVWPDRVRAFVKDTAKKRLHSENAGILMGIMFGDRSGISEQMQIAFRKSGISHITAVSGLHVGLILSFMMLLFYFWGNKRSIFRVFYIIGVLSVVVLTGATPSVVRAAVMIILFEIGWIVRRESDGINSLAIAAALLILWNPYTVYDTGFRLSFAATLGILVFASPLSAAWKVQRIHWRWVRFLLNAAAVTVAAQLGTLPFSISSFHQIPILSVFANVLLAPLLPIILGSGILLALVTAVFAPVGIPIAFVCDISLTILRFITQKVASVPFVCLPCPSMPLFILLSYGCALFALYVLLTNKARKIVVISSLLSLACVFGFCAQQWVEQSEVQVSYINVGQGNCSLIRHGGESLLIDGGGSRYSDIGDLVVGEYLYYRGVMNASAVITHYDLDHYDGIVSLIKQGRVKSLYVPKYAAESEGKEIVLHAAQKYGVSVVPIASGDVLSMGDGARLYCVSPDISEAKRSKNDQGIVLLLDANGKTFFFGGDISERMEEALVEKGRLRDADVYEADHHGSNQSNQMEFLNCISPEYVVISYGTNSYGIPGEEAMSRLRRLHAKIFTTKENGTVTFRVTKHGNLKWHTTK